MGTETLTRWAAQRLETGAWRNRPARALAAIWEHFSEPVRPVALPQGVRMVGLGGATLGGSGKTPLTAALARALATEGRLVPPNQTRDSAAPVAVVASGYRARVKHARPVTPMDEAREVGDEALMLARSLAGHGVPVVVGPERDEAVGVAASRARTVLVDGLLQTRPRRLDCSLLVLDAQTPWGGGHCPPAGDLRARPGRVLEAADAVVLCQDAAQRCLPAPRLPRPIYRVKSTILGARTPDGGSISVAELQRVRLGLLLAVARPDRIRCALARRGIIPVVMEFLRDHANPRRTDSIKRANAINATPKFDAWLTSSKCATKLGEQYAGRPVWVLRQDLDLPRELVTRCAGTAPGHADR